MRLSKERKLKFRRQNEDSLACRGFIAFIVKFFLKIVDVFFQKREIFSYLFIFLFIFGWFFYNWSLNKYDLRFLSKMWLAYGFQSGVETANAADTNEANKISKEKV